MQWSWANQLEQTYSSSTAAARYAYGGDGQRVVKRFGSLSGSVLTPSKVTVYLPGGFEITGSFSGGALQVEWQSLAVMDDRTCVARFEVKAVDGGVATGESAVLRYQVGSHLGSACLETTDAGQVLTREEYYPYGGTAYAFAASGAAGFSVKRYRYAGRECDSENGLYYFGARYFAAWLGRWTAGDPVFAAGRSPFEYCDSNPISKVDPDGRWPREYHEELAVQRPQAFAAQGRIGAPAALTAVGIAVSVVGVGYGFAAFGPAAGAVALADEAFGHATGIPISPSSAVRIARNPIKAIEQTVEAARGVAAAVRSAGSGVHVAEKIAVASESAGTAARRAPGGAESGLRAGLPRAGGGIDSGAEAALASKGAGQAHSAADFARYKEHLRQAEKYGQGGFKELESGRFRYYGELTPARTPGEMAGRRLVREWDPVTDATRTWHETLDSAGRVRIVRPETGGPKRHHIFDAEGSYVGTR